MKPQPGADRVQRRTAPLSGALADGSPGSPGWRRSRRCRAQAAPRQTNPRRHPRTGRRQWKRQWQPARGPGGRPRGGGGGRGARTVRQAGGRCVAERR
eukprot:1927383-Prymnesium_polylepis.2